MFLYEGRAWKRGADVKKGYTLTHIYRIIAQHALYQRVFDFIERRHLLRDLSHIDLALSGGADSVCLLAVLSTMRANGAPWTLRAHHIRHGMRASDGDDAALAKHVASQLDVDYIQTDLQLGALDADVENTARNARYEALFCALQTQPPPHVLALAHNGSENLETAIWRLGRGCGLEGLTLAPLRYRDHIRLIRPLLEESKSDIYDFLRSCHLPWIEDPTNASDHYLRNIIRHSILPKIDEISHGASVLHRSLLNLNADAAALSHLAHNTVHHYFAHRVWFCPWRDWCALGEPAQSQLFRHVARHFIRGFAPTAAQIQRALAVVNERKQTCRCVEWGNFVWRWSRDGVCASLKDDAPLSFPSLPAAPFFDFELPNFGKLSLFPVVVQSEFRNASNRLLFCSSGEESFTIRPAGAFSTLIASDGRRVKTREALRSQGVPEPLRKNYPVLCCGDEPLWIFGGMRTQKAQPPAIGQNALLLLWTETSVERVKNEDAKNG